MKYLSLLLILVVSNSNLVYADGQIIQIDKGQPAPFSGFLMDNIKARSFDNLRLDFEFAQKNILVLQEQNKLYSDQLTKSNDLISNLNKQALETKSDSIWYKAGYFILGAACATLVAYGAVRVTR